MPTRRCMSWHVIEFVCFNAVPHASKQPTSVLERVTELFDPSVSRATVVNEGSIFLLLTVWYVGDASLATS